jgi:putative two-component system response regulator
MMKRILVVDDNIASLHQIGSQLEGSYKVVLVKSGVDAIKYCSRVCPDLVLLDIEMPVVNGFETIAELKKIPEAASVPVIFLTGNPDEAREIEALESGAVDFITKPIEKSILLHRIELHLQLYNYQTNLENTVSELEHNVVVCFADLIECKDESTGGHVMRTSRYMDLIGRELLAKGLFPELTEDELRLMVRAAPFHDIGKIGISDVILLKPSSLTEDEYEEVKQHTLIGGRVLSNIFRRTPSQTYLKYAVMLAEGHHEKYDGSGYPRGLKGDNIPLCCRIMSVANVYDACVTDRVYRKAMTHEETRAVILKGSGTVFDPQIVDAFEAAHDMFATLDVRSHNLLGSWEYSVFL